MVSLGIMNAQINIRLPQKMLVAAKIHVQKHGFPSLQDFIRETIRERLFEPELTRKELKIVRKIYDEAEKKGLWGTEEDLFKLFNKK